MLKQSERDDGLAGAALDGRPVMFIPRHLRIKFEQFDSLKQFETSNRFETV